MIPHQTIISEKLSSETRVVQPVGEWAIWEIPIVPIVRLIYSDGTEKIVSEGFAVVHSDVSQDVSINLLGDVNGDGRVNMKDWGALYDHINEVNPLW